MREVRKDTFGPHAHGGVAEPQPDSIFRVFAGGRATVADDARGAWHSVHDGVRADRDDLRGAQLLRVRSARGAS